MVWCHSQYCGRVETAIRSPPSSCQVTPPRGLAGRSGALLSSHQPLVHSAPPQEEMAELKAQLYLLEKEKKALELKLSTREAQEQAYLVHIEHLKSEVEEQKEQRTRSLSSTSSGGKDAAGKVGRGPGSASPPAEPEAGKVGRGPGSASPPGRGPGSASSLQSEAGKVGRASSASLPSASLFAEQLQPS